MWDLKAITFVGHGDFRAHIFGPHCLATQREVVEMSELDLQSDSRHYTESEIVRKMAEMSGQKDSQSIPLPSCASLCVLSGKPFVDVSLFRQSIQTETVLSTLASLDVCSRQQIADIPCSYLTCKWPARINTILGSISMLYMNVYRFD
jgi:hypothetical protein